MTNYSCPMHPEARSDKPGMCPECGMALVKEEEDRKRETRREEPAAAEFDKHAGHKTGSFLQKFWVSFILTIPVVLYSDLVRETLGLKLPLFPGAEYMPLVLGSAVFFYGGWIFLVSAVRELRARLPGMMTLIALAITAAYAYSVGAVFLVEEGETLFWELTTLITIMLLGHWLEMRAVRGAQGALRELSKLLPDTAEVVRGNGSQLIPLSELRENDIVFVRPGGKIPADGQVIEGKSEVDESLMTGESRPVTKVAGDEVIAGSVNGDGSLKIRVTKIGEHTFLAGVMRLVAEAQASKSRLQILSDRAAFYLTLIAIGIGGTAFVAWLAAGAGVPFAVTRLVAVLVIACPHALGLAVPLVASLSTTLAARQGFLVKRRLALEAARNVDIVLFDKTGTLTRGEYGVTEVIGDKPVEILKLAAAVDAHSEHFISKAIVKEAKARNISIPEVKEFERLPGRGVKGIVDGKPVFVGGEAILEKAGAKVPADMREKIARLGGEGRTVVYVASEGRVVGAIALGDVIREESREAIKSLKEAGIKTAMVTGDSEDVAKWVAGEVGIDEYFARVLPGEKAGRVKALQERGLRVAMVGDGINDAPALTQADVGIAIGAGTNIAIESAGIILVRDDPRDIVKIVRLSRLTYSKMLQNLFWAAGYNVAAIPLAAGLLYPWGIILEPAVAAILMSLSTVIVAINALLLRREKLANRL